MRRVLAPLLIALPCLMVSGCSKSGEPAAGAGPVHAAREVSRPAREGKDPRGPRTVRVAPVVAQALGESVTVTGTLAAYDRVTVATKVAGRLQTLAVDLGSRVRKGQLVARIEPLEYELRVQQAQAALAQARARLGLSPEGGDDRVEPGDTGTVRQARAVLDEARLSRDRAAQLAEAGLIGRAEQDAAEAAFKVADSRYQDALEEIQSRRATASQRRAEAALARQQLADTGVYAAFSGAVEQRRASPGEFLPAGAPILDLVRIDPLRFRAEVPEREAASVRTGQAVRISSEGAPREYTGRIARLSPTISERSRVLLVEADVPNDGSLRAGTFVRAVIETGQSSPSATVPTSAIVTFAGLQKVITVREGKAQERAVSTGRRTPEWTEVLSGVVVGEQVVLSPGNLQSGEPVVVAASPQSGGAGAHATDRN